MNEIGIRVPESSFVCRLSEAMATVFNGEDTVYADIAQNAKSSASSIPIVLTSANLSGEPSTLSPDVSIVSELNCPSVLDEIS